MLITIFGLSACLRCMSGAHDVVDDDDYDDIDDDDDDGDDDADDDDDDDDDQGVDDGMERFEAARSTVEESSAERERERDAYIHMYTVSSFLIVLVSNCLEIL